jgi:hypothetical protein
VLLLGHFLQRNLRFVPVETTSVIGAGGYTIPTTDAPVIVHYDNPVRLYPGGRCRACFDTRGVLAVETLNPHIKMILNRHFMEVFAVANIRGHLTVFQLKDADILSI